jgi:hypothetical protein
MKQKRLSPIHLLVLSFFIPLLVGTLLFYYHDKFTFTTTNHGHLIQPVINVADSINLPKQQWHIVYAPKTCCDADCAKTVFNLVQMRKLLGKNQKRLSLTLLADQQCQISNGSDMVTVSYTQKLNQIFTLNHIYLVDPMNNAFMVYADSENPLNILKDLKRLLEVSQIG